MRWPRSLILDTGVAVVFPAALLFSLFLLTTGHNAPGGGFVGGLVAGAALVLRYVAAGARSPSAGAPGLPPTLLGTGLMLAVLTGGLGLLSGNQFLDARDLGGELPVVGEVHTTTALPFDIGVYLVVVGLVLAILDTLGAEPAEPAESAEPAGGER